MGSEANPNSGGDVPTIVTRVPKHWQRLVTLPSEFAAKVQEMILQLKKVGKDDPRRVIHSLKVALAITIVSAFYYLNPLYDGFGSSGIWAVFTVVFVSEFSVGATLGKGVNRGIATLSGSALGLGCYYMVCLISRGDHTTVEPVLLGVITFLSSAGATYLRFLPQLKVRYDYGLLIFILTFSFVSLSSYRESNIQEIVKKRIITILTGCLISVSVCIFVCPIWAGGDLHNLVSKNIEKLGNFIEGFGKEYFTTSEVGESNIKSYMQGYKSVLDSKQVEQNLANLAKWEPCHGRFRFHHPWQQYLKIGNLTRQCAFRIDALNGFLNSTMAPLEIRSKIQDPCMKMSTELGMALKELAVSIQKMIPPCAAEPHIAISKIAAAKLRSMIQTGLWEGTNLFEVVPVVTMASLLLDVVSCTERLAESIQELSSLAKFKHKESKIAAENSENPHDQEEAPQSASCDNRGPHHVIAINQPCTNLSHDGKSQLLRS
ncbi:aluminum-activated malate transporter 2-like [Lotus japonicus]|uniref:aluminum-activated malate transporter 2-like n=1 Tax=Lotus japonicus TaxID=34305 RepID=UPI00258A84AE|nr:aluminum-activated malate transporter 2-like [Lotus japonicus]